MKNQRNQGRYHIGLVLTLLGFICAATLVLSPARLASAQAVAPSWSYTGNLNTARGSHTATPLQNGKQSDSASISSTHAQENPQSLNRWSSNGPEGATILCLAIDPSHPATIYAGTAGYGGDYLTNGGLFKSTDGGESWSHRLSTYAVQALAIDPRTPTTLYATINGYDSLGRLQAGVSKSLNGGASWFASNNGLVDQAGRTLIVNALAIDPNNPNIIYASGEFSDPDAPYEGSRVYKTTNGGGSWSQIAAFSSSIVTVSTLAIDPINPNTLYAGGRSFPNNPGGNVFKSTNSGGSWSVFNVGPGRPTIQALAIDPTNPNTIYAGGEGGAYKSIDGAQSWNAINDGLGINRGVSALAIDPDNPSILYVGFYGGTTTGIFKSVNGGGSWSAFNSGFTAPYVLALAINPVNTAIIYAGSYNSRSGDGIFKSVNGGASWSASNRGLGGVGVGPLAVDPANASTIYAGTYKSTDNGGSWKPLRISPTNSDISALAIDPFNTATVYAGAESVYKSTNGGESWIDTGLRSPDIYNPWYVFSLAIDPRNSNIIYAVAGSFGTSLFKSTNGGGSWSAIGDLNSPLSLVIDPGNSNILYSVSYFSGGGCADDDFCTTVHKSTDGGVTWSRSDTGTNFLHVSGLAIDPNNTATIYVSDDGVLYKSRDGGGTWSAIGTGLPNSGVSSLAIDPINPNDIYAGTYGSGVFKSADGGATWNPFNDGLTNLSINSLAIDRSGNFLHAATSAGVFDIQLAVPTHLNQIDDARFFVREHYLDFLNRQPDAGGLAYWTNEITKCGSDTRCIHERRIGVSAAFFIELEFQETGYYVYRFYKASFGRQPNYTEFTSDRGRIIVDANLEANKQAFSDEWVQRAAFRDAYPVTMSNTEVVNKLFDTAGLTASIYNPQRQQEIAALNSGRSRALVLRDVIEIPDFKNIPDPNNPRYNELKQISQYNPAFVLMQYFGYLRRNVDQDGYEFWLDVVNNREPNNYGAMVCAFITSSEYQLRFGSVVTRSNADCAQ